MLQIHGLTCGYGSGFLLRDINLYVTGGDMLGIIGPNGSGKTTLLRAITKVITPSEGEVALKSQDIKTLSAKMLAKKIAVVSKANDEDVKITVEEYVFLGRIPHREGIGLLETKSDLEVVRRAMELTDVIGLKDRLIDSLSSGERQLASIARAIAQEPDLLLLDEPTSHLDIGHQIKVLDLIRMLNRETGLTVMVVLHDLNLAAQYCDRLLLLDNGCVYKEGTPEEVLTYQTVEAVYKTVVVVRKNPISSKPYVILISGDERNERSDLTNR